MSFLDLQIALRRCGFTTEQEAILWDAMVVGKGVHMKLEIPEGEAMDMPDASGNTARAVRDWRARRYDKFGERLGVALREVVLEAFPEKYWVDDTGALRTQLISLADAGDGAPLPTFAARGGAVALLSAALVSAAALLAVRAWRTSAALRGDARYRVLRMGSGNDAPEFFDRISQSTELV